MIRYIGKRVLKIIPVLLVVTVISFFVTHLMPGDPVKLLLGDHASKEQILSMQQQLNLDKPLLVQFRIWFMNSWGLGRVSFWQSACITDDNNKNGTNCFIGCLWAGCGDVYWYFIRNYCSV